MRSAVLLAVLLLAVTVPAAATITVGISQPTGSGYVGDVLNVVATVSSTYQIQSVTATVADRSTSLTFASGVWSGTLNLAGLPRGTLAVQVVAQDVFAETGSASRSFNHDRLPAITITAPLPDTVARPTLHVVASCEDDDPAGCTSLEVSYAGNSLAMTQSSIDQVVSLDQWDGRGSVQLDFFAHDSTGRGVAVNRRVHVDSSPTLREVLQVPGAISDVHADRVLYRGWPDNTVGMIRDRTTGTDVATLSAPGAAFNSGFLAPRGALFEASGNLYELQDGATFPLLSNLQLLRVALPYAIYMNYVSPYWRLYRRNLVAGTTIEVPTTIAANNYQDVAADGTVAFYATDYNVYLYKNDALQPLTTATPSYWYIWPRTDGTNTVYAKVTPCCGNQMWAIMHHNGTTEVEIEPPRLQETTADRDYLINNGWIAVRRLANGGVLQVWRIAPGGAAEQVSFFGTSSLLQTLAADGELTFTHGFPSNDLYLSKPSVPAYRIGSAIGNARRIGADWHVTIGRSLFLVDDLETTTTTLASSPNPSAPGQNVTFTATVSGIGATGTVVFRRGARTIGNGTLSGGTASFSTSSLATGSHNITAVYSGDANFGSSTSTTHVHPVKTASTTAISSSANPSSAGQSVTFTATVTPAGATGTVTFADGATALGTAPLSGGTAAFSTSSLSAGVHSITATYSGDATYGGSTSSALSQEVFTPFGAPAGVVATATSSTRVVVSWAGVSGAASYEIVRASNGSLFTFLGSTGSTSFVNEPVSPNTTYVYMVRAVAGGGTTSQYSNADAATTVMFTHDPLVPGATAVRAEHLAQLRIAVNAMRATASLPPATFSTDSVVRAVHVQELRDALDPARAGLFLPALPRTDPTLVPGATLVKAAHVQELRDGCK